MAIDAASGRWPELLAALANLTPEQLSNTHQPCPNCGGTDRYRWDKDDGPGGWFCSHCGGKDGRGGAGSGMDLLMRVSGWTFKEACQRVEQHLGIPSSKRPAPSRTTRPHRIPDQPPPDAPPPQLGNATAQWCYRNAAGHQLFWVQRIPQPAKTATGKSGKIFVHRTWLDGRWHHPSKRDPFKSEWPAPRPIYRLPDLADRPDAPVIVCEGEKAADAAANLFPDFVCVAWCGGVGGINAADWQALADRVVTLWPDADDAGRYCMDKLAAKLLPICVSVSIVTPPSHLPSGWDLADSEGWSQKQAINTLRKFSQPAQPATTPEPSTKQQPAASATQSVDISEVKDSLREAIAEGINAADLTILVADLAARSDQSTFTIQRLADAIRADQAQSAAVDAEARQLAAEQDRIDLGRVLSTDYLLPSSIANAINIRSRYLPCEGPSAALPFLAAIAGLVKLGTEVEGCAVAGYRVPVNLYTCLVGRSGAKKSPISRLLVDAPTAELRAELALGNQRERQEWEDSCRESKRGDQKPQPPSPKRLVVSDFTGEALAAQLQTQESAGLGLLVNRDELSGLFGSMNAYRGGRGADEQQLLELFDGGGMNSLRIIGDRHYNRSQVSIYGSTQPDVLRQLVGNGDATGLWARFLFVPLPERAIQLPLAATPAEVAQVDDAARTLAKTCRAVYSMPRQTYKLSQHAAERFANYELGRQTAAMRATIGAQSALYGKSAGKVLRLSGVIHILSVAAGQIPASSEIGADTVDRATCLVDHLDAWALGLHAEVAAGGVGQLMRTVHRIAEAAAAPIRWKEFTVRLSGKARKEISMAGFEEAARALAQAGYGQMDKTRRGAITYQALRPLP